jgi:prephenate dehydratase
VSKLDLSSTTFVPLQDIPTVFSAVVEGSVDLSVMPIENSTNGTVRQTLDQISQYTKQTIEDPNARLQILAETRVHVRHCLAIRSAGTTEAAESNGITTDQPDFSRIKTLHTHPQAWTQCSSFLSTHFGDTTQVLRCDEDSTSHAAQLVSEDVSRTSAAICSSLAAQEFGLEILQHDIQDNEGNATKFYIVAKDTFAASLLKKSETVSTSQGESGLVVLIMPLTENRPEYPQNFGELETPTGSGIRAIVQADTCFVFSSSQKEEDHVQHSIEEWQKESKSVWDWGTWKASSSSS